MNCKSWTSNTKTNRSLYWRNTPCPQMLTYERFILICDYFKNYPDWSDTMFPKVGKKIGEKTHSRSGKDYAKVVGSKSNQKIEDINELQLMSKTI